MGAILAHSLADRFRYRGVLLDMGLGEGIDGLEVTRRLRRTSEYARIPIIGITGDPATYSELAAVTCGCDALLIKPVSRDKLAAALLALVA